MIVYPGHSHRSGVPWSLALVAVPLAFSFTASRLGPRGPYMEVCAPLIKSIHIVTRPAPARATTRSATRAPQATAHRTSKRAARVRLSNRFDALILKTAKETGLDPYLIKAVISAESQFNSREVSPAGACGLMQLMPRTAKLLAVKDIFDPEENIRAGAAHLRYLVRRFSKDLALALAAYNAGEVPVLRHKGIPPYPETQFYVRKVLKLYAAYRADARAAQA